MAGKDIDFSVYVAPIKSEIDMVVATIKDKGAQRFSKAIGFALILVGGAYYVLYKPPQDKLSHLQKEIDSARAMSASSSAYQTVRDELAASYANLPLAKDQQQWLSNAMIDSLRADNLTPESFRPIVELEASGLVYQTSSVVLTVKFSDIYFWLMRIESAKPLMHVSYLEIIKKSEMIGMNGVTASVMTAIPKKRYN